MTSQAAGKRADEPTPESARAPARVVYESGIPPSREVSRAEPGDERIEARIQLALAESAGLEMKLRLLVRGLKQLTAAASDVEQIHGSLLNELSELRCLVPGSRGGDASLRKRVDDLERALERTRSSAAHERSSLIQEQEAFLQRLLTDHEQEVGELKRLLSMASHSGDGRRVEVEEEQHHSPVIVARHELPSAECLEVHWEELEDTAVQSMLTGSGGAPRVPRPEQRSSGPPPLPDSVERLSAAPRRTT